MYFSKRMDSLWFIHTIENYSVKQNKTKNKMKQKKIKTNKKLVIHAIRGMKSNVLSEKKLDTKEYILYDSNYMKSKNKTDL